MSGEDVRECGEVIMYVYNLQGHYGMHASTVSPRIHSRKGKVAGCCCHVCDMRCFHGIEEFSKKVISSFYEQRDEIMVRRCY